MSDPDKTFIAVEDVLAKHCRGCMGERTTPGNIADIVDRILTLDTEHVLALQGSQEVVDRLTAQLDAAQETISELRLPMGWPNIWWHDKIRALRNRNCNLSNQLAAALQAATGTANVQAELASKPSSGTPAFQEPTISDKPPDHGGVQCPGCGLGIDTDGDGNCALCGTHDAGMWEGLLSEEARQK